MPAPRRLPQLPTAVSSSCSVLSMTMPPRSAVTSTVCLSSGRTMLRTTVERLGVSDILLALPSASRQRRHQIIEGLRSVPVHIRTLPGMADLASGRVAVSDFRELDLEDLLGRDPVAAELSAAGARPCRQGGAGDRCRRKHRLGTLSADPRGAPGQAVAC